PRAAWCTRPARRARATRSSASGSRGVPFRTPRESRPPGGGTRTRGTRGTPRFPRAPRGCATGPVPAAHRGGAGWRPGREGRWVARAPRELLAMTRRAVGARMNVVRLHEQLAQGGPVSGRLPPHVEDLLARAHVRRRIAMAVEAPLHLQR